MHDIELKDDAVVIGFTNYNKDKNEDRCYA